jgi:16S rRNA (uracil1498-N3)-methyltransferase
MRIPRIFLDQALPIGQEIILPNDRAHYVANVLRLTVGRPLIVFNGQGGEYTANLVSANKKSAVVAVEAFIDIDRESPLAVELAIGLSRGDRMDWIIQKATELGVTRILPLNTETTEVRLGGNRLDKKLQHWQQIIVSACEQSQRNRLPLLGEPENFQDFASRCQSPRKLLLHPTTETFRFSQSKGAQNNKVDQVTILIGPEGGFSEPEVGLATTHGFQCWQLGPRILRTETAPIAALALLQHYWGDC